jgi:beta-glucanase (GH16 family)
MKIFYLTIIAAIYSSAIYAQQKPDTLFFDDFKGNGLNRAEWNYEVTGNTTNNEQQAYVDSTVTLSVANGMLAITPVYHPGYESAEHRKYDFLSSRINTRSKFEFTYGTATARIKMSGGAGLWPAFWALGEGKWPDCGEIDIMETVGDSSWISNAMHGPNYFGNTPFAYRDHFPPGIDVTQWHTYSVKWTKDSVVFSVDGAMTYTVTRTMVEHYGRWAFDNPKFLLLNFAIGGGYPHGVNKITSPYFGLSQSSVDKIKRGEAKMLVDWVLVTKE